MLSDRARDALEGIKINVEAIGTFLNGMTFEAFKSDLRTFYAVTRALEIISEASRKLPDDLKARHANVPWRAIRDSGNVYRHSYDRVAVAFVWDTAREQLHALSEAVSVELGVRIARSPGNQDS